jgi:hypothetical protein
VDLSSRSNWQAADNREASKEEGMCMVCVG